MEGFEPIATIIIPFELQNFLSVQGVCQKEDFEHENYYTDRKNL